MYLVSNGFNEACKAVVRKVYGKVQIDYTDPFLDQSLVISATEQASASYPKHTSDTIVIPFAKYAALDGAWVLDGTFTLAPSEAYESVCEMGWWGSKLAGVGGAFSAPYPALTVAFFSRPIWSFKVVGDSKRVEYPVDFTVKLYGAGDVLKHTETVVGNTLVSWNKDIVAVTAVVKSVLTITKWSHVGRQAKIMEFFTSIQEVYEGEDLLEIKLTEEREISSGSLPVGNISANEISVRLSNITRKFDSNNISSPLYQLIKANRRIKAWLGVYAENIAATKVPTFTRGSVAYKQDGSQVLANVPRYEVGKFGQGVMLEEGTTNLLTYPKDFTHNVWNANLFNNWVIATRITNSGIAPDGTNTATKLIGNYVSGICNVAQIISCVPSATYTFSVWLKDVDSDSVRISISTGLNNALVTENVSGIACVGFSNWTRFSITCAVPASGVNQLECMIWNIPNTKSILAWGAQFESKPYATSFTDGTRSPEALTIPTVGILSVVEGELSIYFKAPSYTFSSGYVDIIDVCLGNAANRFLILRKNPVGDYQMYMRNGGSYSIATFIIPANTWTMLTWTWKSGGNYSLLVNGVSVLTGAYNAGDLTFDNIAFRGGIGYFDNLRISNKARTDAEILAPYQNNKPLEVDEFTTYLLPFNNSLLPVEKCMIPLGTFWSGDWEVPDDSVHAKTTGLDRLELLRKTNYNTAQVQTDKNLYQLAIDVLTNAGLIAAEYWVDTELQNSIVPYSYFASMPHREALRLIAEAALGQVYMSRDNILRIEGASFLASRVTSDLIIDGEMYFTKNNPSNTAEVANYIEVETQPLKPSVASEVYRSNSVIAIAAGATSVLTIYYNSAPCINAAAAISGGVSVVILSATYYAWGAEITIKNNNAAIQNVTLVVTATPLTVLNKERAIAQDAASITEYGKLKYTFPANPLIQSLSVAQLIANKLLASSKDSRRDTSIQWRGNPAVLLSDRVSVVDSNGQSDFHVIKQDITYAGYMRATLNGRRAT